MANETTSNSDELNPEKPFSFREPRQQLIYDGLIRLVSPGAAAFYKDACRLRATKPAFVSAAHLVAHLLREIESALHDVLESITEQKLDFETCSTCGKKIKKTTHGDKIRVVGGKLKLSEEVIEAWLSVSGKKGLQKFAHRSGLGRTRSVDDEFAELWSKIETVFYVVLNNLEIRYSEILRKLDELVKKAEPTKEDAKFFSSNIPNNFNTYTHFFKELNNSKWLTLLRDEGVFSEPPEPEHNPEDRTTRHLPWPAAIYLEKMASTQSRTVKDILNDAKDVDNSNVKAGLLKITANLSKEDRIQLLEKVKGWIKTDHNFFQLTLTDPASKLIIKFIEDGEENAAFALASILLEILPDPKPRTAIEKDELIYVPKRTPQVRLERWHYNEFLKKDFQPLIELNLKRAFDLACSLLQRYLELENEGRTNEEYEDHSSISRPAIENHEQNHNHDNIEDGLINTIRDIGLKIMEADPKQIETLSAKLDARKWTIFRRIGFYLLSEAPGVAPELTKKQLTNKIFFDNSAVEHEFARLLRGGFKILDSEEQKIILDWINKAEKITEYINRRKQETSVNAEQEGKFKEVWQRDQLSYMKDDLPAEYKKRYEDFVSKYGEPEHPDLPFYSTSWVGPVSDFKGQELADMESDKLIELLKTWEPKAEPRGFGSTKEGLGRELGAAIKLKPEYFNNLAEKFIGLDPTYIRGYIQVFGEIAQHDGMLNWEKLLNLSSWIVSQPREIPGRKGEIMDQDPDWSWTRKAISSLISRGMNNNLIPCEFRERVWSIIEPLTHDPDPTPEDDARREETSDDAYSSAINSARGEAMSAVAEYALWVYRCTEKDPDGKEKVKSGFAIMPEVRKVLNWHLDPSNDPSIAIRAIYGRFFPWLLLMDRKWVLDNLNRIFPLGQFNDRLYTAAWNTIMLYTQAYNDLFEVLKDRYLEAVENLGKVDKNRTRYTDRDERVAEHLMLFYGRGKIELSDKILERFWEVASDKLRGHALDFVGRSLKSDNADIDPRILERSKVLWESRIAVAKKAQNQSIYENEMSAFGWWFASGKFDEKWSSDQYLDALEIGKKTQTDYFVAEHLVELVKILPLESVKILSKMVLVDKPGWIVLGNKNEVKAILSTALNAPEQTAQEEARNLINRLVARGYIEFNDLLQ